MLAQCEDALALVRAVGRPRLEELLPSARASSWVRAAAGMRAALAAREVRGRVRSASALWRLLRGGSPPPGATWGWLLAGRGLGHLVEGLEAGAVGEEVRLASWNARWLVSLDSTQVALKREAVRKWLDAGRVVLLQETHWNAVDALVWESRFPGARVVSSPAVAGPGGGRLGGVAIVVPHGYDLLGHRVLCDGYAVEATVSRGGTAQAVVSLYLPPGGGDSVRAVVGSVAAAVDGDPEGPGRFVGGDVNVDTESPRQGEEETVADLRQLLHRLGCACLPGPRATRRWRGGVSRIDIVAAPCGAAWRWKVTADWRLGLSDHAVLLASATTDAPVAARALNPAAFKAIPPEGLLELRGRFHGLMRLFRVPPGGVTPPAADGAGRPARVEELPCGHPARGALDEWGEGRASDDVVPEGPDSLVPRMGALARHGRAAMSAMIAGWWRKWRRKRRGRDAGQELASIARGEGSRRVAGPLADWLVAMGCDDLWLGPRDAAVWLERWRGEQSQGPMARLPAWQRGPAAGRPAASDAVRLGRRLFAKGQPLKGLRRESGVWEDDPAAMEAMLWDSRAEVWGTAPPVTPAARLVLDQYFASRSLSAPAVAAPRWNRIAKLVLAVGGSAPGLDGEPYEVYQCGVRFVVALLAQACYAAEGEGDLLDDILGPSVDLLVWIHKHPGAERVGEMRPLQLPTCFRRLFGTVVASEVGPLVEPLLCEDQAARAGGHCGPNITRAFRFLEGGSGGGAVGADDDLWRALVGPLAPVVESWEAGVPTAIGRGVLFSDQAQAFERIGLAWFREVLIRWGLPPRLVRSFMALVAGRSVRSVGAGGAGPVRTLHRSVGMGGTASPLGWTMGYDPIVEIVGRAAGVRRPTYVDDIVLLVRGARQAVRAFVALLVAGHAAGLLVKVHTCEWVRLEEPRGDELAALRRLPVSLESGDGFVDATGLTAAWLCAVLAAVGADAGRVSVQRRECRCTVKNALVPCRQDEPWGPALADTPIAGAVKLCWPCLGVTVASCGDAWGRGERAQLHAVAEGSWKRPRVKLHQRAGVIAACHASIGRRAAEWNMYCASLSLYPAHAVVPGGPLVKAMYADTRLAVLQDRGRWCPVWVLTGLGVALGVRGAPRCPVAVARAVGALAAARGDQWGPAPARREQAQWWARLLTWARSGTGGLGPGAWERLAKQREALRAAAQAMVWDRGAASRRVVATAAYAGIWAVVHGRAWARWLSERAASRAWAGDDGNGWRLLVDAGSFTVAFSLLKFLVNALPGEARWRGRDDRERYRTLCGDCGAPAQVQWASAGPDGPGRGWCRPCWASRDDRPAWALLPRARVHRALLPWWEAHGAAGRASDDDGAWGTRFAACPLCGRGEAGAGHLLHWCAAVALSWRAWAGDDAPHVAAALAARSGWERELVPFLHQVVFLHSSLYGAVQMDCEVAARRIVRGCRRTKGADAEGVEVESGGDSDDGDAGGDDGRPNGGCWAPATAAGCPRCAAAGAPGGGLECTSVGARRSGSRGGGELVRRPAAARGCVPGDAVAALVADSLPAGWLLPGAGWWPRPRRVAASEASCEWAVRVCEGCGANVARLVVRCALARGDEVTTSWNPSPASDDAAWPWEVTFDGGSREVGGRRIAGAGAALWAHHLGGGGPTLVCTSVVAIPWDATAQVAEAIGCCAALRLLRVRGSGARRARVVGDNLAVIRYCAGSSRLRAVPQQALLEAELGRTIQEGWTVDWQAVRRRLNTVADALATRGIGWADRLLAAGTRGIWVEDEEAGQGPSAPMRMDAWCQR